jgi:hypothetical protein
MNVLMPLVRAVSRVYARTPEVAEQYALQTAFIKKVPK